MDTVARSPLPIVSTVQHLGIPRATYYLRRQRHPSETPRARSRSWNRLRPTEWETILRCTHTYSDLTSREIACYVTDHDGFSVSESTVYCRLTVHGFILPITPLVVKAVPEFHRKTIRIHELWATDFTYVLVRVGLVLCGRHLR